MSSNDTERAAPSRQLARRSISPVRLAARARAPSGWVAPATRYSGRGSQVGEHAPWRRSPTRCPCPARAGPRSTAAGDRRGGRSRSRRSTSAGGVVAPWGITDTLAGSTSKPATSRRRAVLGHHDDRVGGVADLLEHDALVRRRVAAAPCGRRRRSAPSTASQDVEDVVAVDAAVDAVLVLHDGDVGAVERLDRRPSGAAEPSPERRRPPADPRRLGARRSARRRPTAPCATSPAASAAENVAMPHDVGGNVDRIPNERTAPLAGSGRTRGGRRPRRAPDVGSVEASSLRRATEP